MGKIYGKKVPSVNLSLGYDTHKQWKKWTERELLKEVTKLLDAETKKVGRAVGTMRIVYAKDPAGDFVTRFDFHSTEDCLYKLKPAIEGKLLEWFYEANS